MKDLLDRIISIVEAHFDKIMETFASGGNSQNLISTCSGNLNGLSLANLCYDILGNARPSTERWQAGAYQFTWSNGDNVWLYSKSDGTVVLTDTTGTDIGAFPYSTASSTGSRRRIHR
jgi:hypothetical protein